MKKITITGRLVADVQKQITTNGKEYIELRIANNDFNNEKDAEGKPTTYWFRGTSFNPQFFGLAQYLKKGKPIIVTGTYSDNIYQSKITGNCEISRNILIDSIEFIDFGSNKESQQSSTSSAGNTTNNSELPKVTNTPASQTMKATKEVIPPEEDDEDDLPF